MGSWDFHRQMRVQRARAIYAFIAQLAHTLLQRLRRSRFVIQLTEVA